MKITEFKNIYYEVFIQNNIIKTNHVKNINIQAFKKSVTKNTSVFNRKHQIKIKTLNVGNQFY